MINIRAIKCYFLVFMSPEKKYVRYTTWYRGAAWAMEFFTDYCDGLSHDSMLYALQIFSMDMEVCLSSA